MTSKEVSSFVVRLWSVLAAIPARLGIAARKHGIPLRRFSNESDTLIKKAYATPSSNVKRTSASALKLMRVRSGRPRPAMW